jgi:group I intron endonuclease
MTNGDTDKQDNRIHYLYRITNKINGKIYIGQSIDTIRRWYEHKRDAALEKPTMVITWAIKKYGNDAFEFDVIAGCQTWEDANETEALLIAQYGSLAPNGYNVALGGYNAPKSEKFKQMMRDWHASLSPEEKEKRRQMHSESTRRMLATKGHPCIGLKWTDEQKAKLSASLKALDKEKIYTPEVRKNMSEAHIGKAIPDEQRQKMSEGIQKWWNSKMVGYKKCRKVS